MTSVINSGGRADATGAGTTSLEPRRRPGRQAKISKEAIAQAVVDIGIDVATVKHVATHLGVSTAGLYHHVNGRDDLRRLASELLLSEEGLPPNTGQSWPEWLREVAWYLRTRLSMHPAVLAQYVDGAGTEQGLQHLEDALAVLSRFRFSPASALDAFQAIGQLAVGASTDDLREQLLARSGQATVARLYNTWAALDPEALPRVRQLFFERGPSSSDRFDERVTFVLRGIAAQRGESWSRAQRVVEREHRARS